MISKQGTISSRAKCASTGSVSLLRNRCVRSSRLHETLGFKDSDDMLVKIGNGKESAQLVANRLLKILVDKGTEDAEKPGIGTSASSTGKMPPMLTSVKRPKKHETHADNGIVVRGIDDVLVRLSRCCNPVPGDDIVGFVTRGRGVSVHRSDWSECAGPQASSRTHHRSALGRYRAFG